MIILRYLEAVVLTGLLQLAVGLPQISDRTDFGHVSRSHFSPLKSHILAQRKRTSKDYGGLESIFKNRWIELPQVKARENRETFNLFTNLL